MEYKEDGINDIHEKPHLHVSVFSSHFENASNGIEIPIYIYITISLANVIIFLVGIVGNILVIFVIIKVRNMRTPTNMFLLNLSAADILLLLICQPAGLLELFGKDRWFLGAILCKIVPFTEKAALHVSILTMLAVTFERYHAICHPMSDRTVSTISAAMKIIFAIWIVAMVMTLPVLILTEHEDALFYDGSPIKVCRTKVNDVWRYCFTILIFIAFFVLPLFILIGHYVCIIKQLMSDRLIALAPNDSTPTNVHISRKQVVQMLIFIIVLFFVSLFPIRVVSLWLMFTPKAEVIDIGLDAYLNLVSWVRILMYIHSAANPIIYSFTSTKFKSAFKRVLGGGTNRFPRSNDNNRPGNRVKIPLSRLTPLLNYSRERLPQNFGEASAAPHNVVTD